MIAARRALAVAAAMGAVFAAHTAAAADWPSASQIAVVHQRRAAFPAEHLVSAADWYAPLETVQGAGHPTPVPARPPERRTIATRALGEAVAYAAAQDSYALLVWRKGALELETYGAGFGPDSRYETAFLHKTVLALALGAAAASGAIKSVDDPLSRYLPDLADKPQGAITLRELLEMRGGIETPTPGGPDSSIYWQYYFGDDLHQAVAHWPLTCARATEFCYANASAEYLGWALEAATHQRYAAWLSTALWRPLGAGDARLWLDHPGGGPRFHCCLQATARDWLKVGRLILDRGRANGRQIVPASWIDHMTAPSAANPNFGWMIWRGSPYTPLRAYSPHLRTQIPAAQPFARDDVVYLEGSGGQRVYVIPSEAMVIVRIGAPSATWDDSRLPNLILAGLA